MLFFLAKAVSLPLIYNYSSLCLCLHALHLLMQLCCFRSITPPLFLGLPSFPTFLLPVSGSFDIFLSTSYYSFFYALRIEETRYSFFYCPRPLQCLFFTLPLLDSRSFADFVYVLVHLLVPHAGLMPSFFNRPFSCLRQLFCLWSPTCPFLPYSSSSTDFFWEWARQILFKIFLKMWKATEVLACRSSVHSNLTFFFFSFCRLMHLRCVIYYTPTQVLALICGTGSFVAFILLLLLSFV